MNVVLGSANDQGPKVIFPRDTTQVGPKPALAIGGYDLLPILGAEDAVVKAARKGVRHCAFLSEVATQPSLRD
jgi:hypothetical protein